MKKAICLILCLFSCLFAFGCGGLGLDMNLSKDDIPAWSYSGTGYEKSSFKVVRTDGKGNVLGSGALTLTLSKNEEYSTSALTYNTLISEFTFTQNGVTDTIYGKAIFENESVYTVYSEKSVSLASDPSKNYKFVCDYRNEAKQVQYFIGENETPATLSTEALLSAHSGAVYDNESLYYLARAFNADSQQYGNFALTNLYDCYLASNVNTYSVYYRTTIDQYLTDFSLGKLTSWGVNSENLSCYKVSLSINGDMSGPPVELWYTDPNINFGDGNNKKVLAKIATTSYKIPSGEIDFVTTFLLDSYTTVRE